VKTFDPAEILACPRCKGELTESDGEIVCLGCQLAFPVRDGIPVLLVEEARPTESS